MTEQEIQYSKDKIDRELKIMEMINKHESEMKSKVIMVLSFTLIGFIFGVIVGRLI